MIIRIISILILSLNVNAKITIKGIRVWPSPGSTRVVFDLSEKTNYSVFNLDNPDRVVIDFSDAIMATKLPTDNLATSNIVKIRSGEHQGKLRIVLDTKGKLQPEHFILKPFENYGHRVVFDLGSEEKQRILALFDIDEQTATIQAPTTNSKSSNLSSNFIIAIDAGHGGEDPGAIGPRGTREKDVVLAISRKLKREINQHPGMRAILTRSGDYYIGLRQRMIRARKRDADLFISVHADAFKNPRAKGASVFVLSDRGATSEAAKWLAESENRSDMIGGVSLDDKGDMLTSVLLDLSQAANEAASLEAANHVLKYLGKTSELHKDRVERAGFAVLKAPDVPSLLVETGFISNPKTERKLRTSSYQQQLAKQIHSGVKQYFKDKPPKLLSSKRRYKVKKGDTISAIADKFNVELSDLLQLNQIKGHKILVDQVLIIPRG